MQKNKIQPMKQKQAKTKQKAHPKVKSTQKK